MKFTRWHKPDEDEEEDDYEYNTFRRKESKCATVIILPTTVLLVTC